MRKVINGKMYDTDTATVVAKNIEYEDEQPYSKVTLYKKKTGEFYFLCEKFTEDKKVWIEPIVEDDAKDFAEKVLDGDQYEAVFGKVEE
jgi:hypothetical protein